ncbi:MAG TPA: response regulator, partial [Planctomycetota bacterium]|nr:response regulator [Planctomycetota bacterium]
MDPKQNRRVLVVDDNRSIQEDFRKILGAVSPGASELDALAGDLFGAGESRAAETYELSLASQGQEALQLVQAAVEAGRPFAVAFVDVRMPPGWDGIETIRRLWEADPDLQCVVCTAYSDYSYEETVAVLGRSERFLILKKPFDPIEVQQLAAALTSKWTVALKEREHFDELRAYAASLETVNRALHADKATAQAWAESRSDFLIGAARSIARPVEQLALAAEHAADTQDAAGL